MKKKFFYIFFISSVFVISLFGDCELVKNDELLSYREFQEAQNLYDDNKYVESYNTLLKSLRTYKSDLKSIDLKYSCVNYIPGPYAPVIKKSSKSENFAFDRKSLGVLIKRELNPAPYVFIQFKKDKTVVSVLNSVKTSRKTLKNRLPLEKFTVTIGNTALKFDTIKVGKIVTRYTYQAYKPTVKVTTDEYFGFKLY